MAECLRRVSCFTSRPLAAATYGLYALACVLFLVLHNINLARYILKPVPLFLLALLALYYSVRKRCALLHCEGRLAAARPFLITVAFFLYGLGDLLMEFEVTAPVVLYAGTALFAVGHVLMIVVLSTTGNEKRPFHPVAFVPCIPYMVLCWTSVIVLFMVMHNKILFAFGLFVYITILLTVLWRSVARIYSAIRERHMCGSRHMLYRTTWSWREVTVSLGYHLFMVSDVILIAHTYTNVPASVLATNVIVMILYWTSALLISAEVFTHAVQMNTDNFGPMN